MYCHCTIPAHKKELLMSPFLCYNYKVKKIKSQKIIVCLFLLLTTFFYGGFVYAEKTDLIALFYININKSTALSGYTINAFDESVKISLPPGALNDASGVEIKEISEEMEMPWQVDKISKIFQFELKNKTAYDAKNPLGVQLSYDQATNNYKQIFYYDKNYNSWRPLPSKDYPDKLFVRAQISLPFARVAIFDYPDILTSGKASWYAHKKGNFAASPDFPKGSKLRVYNTQNNKFIDVEINDYGPERNLHPDRVIDLEKNAFSKLARTGAGTINVKVEPLYIAPQEGKILGVADSGATAKPAVAAKSAVVVDEETGEAVFEKNSTSTLPLASLTKLVAIKVFLDTRPSLDKTVAYSVNDEEYNYQYVGNKWESARLKINDGDTLTVQDLIYSSLVGSSNNTIETLARVSGLSRNDFIGKMNEAATGWGAFSTRFVEPTGLSPANVSSAADYAIITKEVFKNPIIEKTSAAKEYKFYTFSADNAKKKHNIKNTNSLIAADRLKIAGSKTGYLDEAGYCLMTRVKASGGNIIAVIMGAPTKAASVAEMEELLRYGIKKIND